MSFHQDPDYFDSFRGNPKLKPAGMNFKFSDFQLKEIIKCKRDIKYFIANYCKIATLDYGIISLVLRDYQHKMIDNYVNHNRCIALWARQSGKTVTTIIYFLWLSLFHDTKTCGILANNQGLAIEILDRYKMMYEHVPKWMQQGIMPGGWNKKKIVLENGSRLIAASTSSAAVRGFSLNAILCDEFSHVPSHIQRKFFNSTLPVISSGKTTKVFISSTPNGMEMFHDMWFAAKEGKSDYVHHQVDWQEVPQADGTPRDERWKDSMITELGSAEAFEAEFSNQFIGSGDTLISSNTLLKMQGKKRQPLMDQEGFAIYDYAKDKHSYILLADTAQGKKMDYSAFSIIDITSVPYIQVARYKSNTIPPLSYAEVIYRAACRYNTCPVLIEINDGRDIANSLFLDLDYDNILRVASIKKSQQLVIEGWAQTKMIQLGIIMSTQVKKIGCTHLKTLFEMDKLIVYDAESVKQMTNFVRNAKNSYSCQEPNHDDIAMTLVMLGWCVGQKDFKNFTDHALRENLRSQVESQLDQSEIPFGLIISDGQEEEPSERFGGQLWFPVEPADRFY